MSTTLFKEVGYSLSHLMNSIEMGQIGLPDIQRPFVWKNAKVRDLFDSIYRGYAFGEIEIDGRPSSLGQKEPPRSRGRGEGRVVSRDALQFGLVNKFN